MTTPAMPANQAEESHRWWLLPQLAFVLFVVAVGALLWLTERSEQAEQRAMLVKDVMWLEQYLRFQLTHDEERLGQIGTVQAASADEFEAHARSLLATKSGLKQIIWLNSAQQPSRVFPRPAESANAEGRLPKPSSATIRAAYTSGQPAYSPSYQSEGESLFELHVPIFHGEQIVGIAVGVYSVKRVLEDSIPWWLTERYHLSIADESGKILGSNSRIQANFDPKESYTILLSPPGHGIKLITQPYPSNTPLVGRLLSFTLIFLALIVLWSLWALRRHVQQRLATEVALRNEHAFRKAMEDSLQTGMRARDMDGRIIYVNPAFCAMVGWPGEALVGKAPPMPYWPDEYYDETKTLHDRILAGQGPENVFEFKFKRSNGEVCIALVHEAPLINAEGVQTGWMGSFIDITERKRNDELIQQQQDRLQATARLVAMGEMASSLAHELNQPLAAISSYTAGSMNMLDAPEVPRDELKSALAKCSEQAQRAGRVIRRIYEFVRRAEPKSEPCNLTDIIEELLGLMEIDARRHDIRIDYSPNPDLPIINGDRVLISQALLNLLRNAVDAMRSQPKARRHLAIQSKLESGHLIISISDWGSGIADEIKPHLFEPFYTTKTEGMGMGLNICRSVIEAHHGRLWFEDNPAGGSVFHVQFPLTTP